MYTVYCTIYGGRACVVDPIMHRHDHNLKQSHKQQPSQHQCLEPEFLKQLLEAEKSTFLEEHCLFKGQRVQQGSGGLHLFVYISITTDLNIKLGKCGGRRSRQ
jgi:hypothetical protein